MNRIEKHRALELLNSANLLDLGEQADAIRKELHPENAVTFIVDRNINYTNVCINKCTFCAFYREEDSADAYLLSDDEIFIKIDETVALQGTQILLQGGIHPKLDIDYYTTLLRSIKKRYSINVHGFSPPEICYLADKHGLSLHDTLLTLKQAGLDSIPGGGAEILSDRVREILSPKKIKSGQWLRVMEEAHNIGMRTTATMMFGSVEGPKDIIEHLEAIRSLQDRTSGFTAFIPWSFQPGNTELSRVKTATAADYLTVLALSRIYLDNIKNIQASWVTQGLKLAQVALRFGANDFGSTMIEENVVKAAGVSYCVTKDDIVNAIKSAGFSAAQRDTYYKIIKKF
ncbi:MAG: dehypoxanthine futalosine cyclase [Nitrospirae bacterium]|nr:dehypoxanthine futalosine cyclase [Nitrospirota bacterium]